MTMITAPRPGLCRRMSHARAWAEWAPKALLVSSWLSFGAPALAAQACPMVILQGPEPDLIVELRRHCKMNDVSTATTAAEGCLSQTILVGAAPTGMRLKILGDARPPERTVSSPATAASLIASWTAPSLNGLAWLEAPAPTSTPMAVLDDAEAPGSRPMLSAPPQAPVSTGEVAVPAQASPTRRASRRVFDDLLTSAASNASWWFAASGTASGNGVFGTELELARSSVVGAFDLSPAFRLGYARRANADLVSGADMLEAGAGLHLGRRWRFESWALVPAVAAWGQLRHILPRQSVGVILCGPQEPCTVESQLPTLGSAYQAVTVWAEASLTSELPLSPTVDLRAGVSMDVNPGYISLGAPTVPGPSETTARTRVAPQAPRWLTRMHVGLQWVGP